MDSENKPVYILGIESSCDETAAAIVKDGTTLLSNTVASQIDIQRQFGGVVPEIAARSHIEAMLPVIEKALRDGFADEDGAGTDPWDSLSGIAVTYGPGLSGSLLMGTLTARTLAILKSKPLYAVNHVEAHTYANWLIEPLPRFPLLSLTVSGGHSQLILFRGHGQYELLGQTRDDAAGEAFDKVARMLGLDYPGGPAIAEAAKAGDPHAYQFPDASLDTPYDFSFSGLKTAVLRHLQRLIGTDQSFPSFEIAPHLSNQQIVDTAASFQHGLVASLVRKTLKAYQQYQPASVVIAGGVAANEELRHQLKEALPTTIAYAPIELCTDNAAMIAARGYWEARDHRTVDPHTLKIEPALAMK